MMGIVTGCPVFAEFFSWISRSIFLKFVYAPWMYRSIDCCKIHKKNGKVWIMNGNVGDFFVKLFQKADLMSKQIGLPEENMDYYFYTLV